MLMVQVAQCYWAKRNPLDRSAWTGVGFGTDTLTELTSVTPARADLGLKASPKLYV